jgi:transposase-like protein
MSNSRVSAERWREIFREQRASGLSVAAFCRRAGVPQASFYFWRRKLQYEPRQSNGPGSRRSGVHSIPDSDGRPNRGGRGFAASKAARFVEVQLPTEAVAEASVLELRLPGDRFLVIRPGFDRSTLRALVATLESCPTFVDRPEANG